MVHCISKASRQTTELSLNRRNTGFVTHVIAGASLLLTSVCSIQIFAEETVSGQEEYQSSCAACHGLSGKGDGSMNEALIVAPADLTAIARNNGGLFPTSKIHEIIDGRHDVAGHGRRDMPIWGSRYALEADEKYGRSERDTAIFERIQQLVNYIQGIQIR